MYYCAEETEPMLNMCGVMKYVAPERNVLILNGKKPPSNETVGVYLFTDKTKSFQGCDSLSHTLTPSVSITLTYLNKCCSFRKVIFLSFTFIISPE
jgi:hypothetical protein